ncbi:hypothetical protein HPB50_008499 [Hyalomma asiaticum]|uniref:Uncharacterized protein n=1 Tax=Hyalomma asiaticum TaxID=266040 RepID=A0ACB7TET6_HYAAI|nr:hypothetical protein HPB50_008499 [Hyalomma asiaticum]
MDDDQKAKAHRARHSGRKADKKEKKNENVQELTAKQRNPKAFSVQSVQKAEKKFRRLTLLECNNDINCMIDVAKVADLVLLMVDASYGFEMETFEFLNICQVHGFPRIMGVLSHLDMIKNAKALRHTKKQMKHRFWTEIYQASFGYSIAIIVDIARTAAE